MKKEYYPGSTLEDTVIEGGYCVGCGACASLRDTPYEMRLDVFGKYSPFRLSRTKSTIDVSTVCPFSDGAIDEDELAADQYGDLSISHETTVGYYDYAGAAWVANSESRMKSSSGGIGTLLASRLLAKGLVDAIVHVRPASTDDMLFTYSFSRTTDEILNGQTSRYYPVEMSRVLREIKSTDERVAFFGLPCFIKSLRLLCRQDAELKKRIRYTIGLVCGHLKTSGFAELIAAQLDITPTDLASINFRKKIPGSTANKYGVEVTSKTMKDELCSPNHELYGTNWGHGFFKLKSCDYCDDIFAETADFVIGDAWLPEFASDWKGTNIIVSRHPELGRLLQEEVESERVNFQPLTICQLIKSQEANFRHRREALPLRLKQADRKNIWRPRKRFVTPLPKINAARLKALEMREQIAERTRETWPVVRKEKDPQKILQAFRFHIDPLVDEYEHYLDLSWEQSKSMAARSMDFLKNNGMRGASRATRFVRAVLGVFGLTDGIVILPPSSPGSLGDEAVMTAALDQIRRKTDEPIILLTYNEHDDWSKVCSGKYKHKNICKFIEQKSRRSMLRLLILFCKARHYLVCGTDVLDGQYNPLRSIARIGTIRIASSVGVPVKVLGFSFSAYAHPLARRELRQLNGDVTFLARDKITYSNLQPIVGTKVRLAADPAFLMRPVVNSNKMKHLKSWLSKERKQGNTVVGINANHLMLAMDEHASEDTLINNFTETIIKLADMDENLRFCLLPHDDRCSPSDFDIADSILQSIGDRVNPRVETLPRNVTAAEVKFIVGELDCVFTGKMHLAIAALGSCVPVGAIVYKDKKFHGLFEYFDLTEWLLPASAWKRTGDLVAFIRHLIDARTELKERITNRQPYVHMLASNNFRGL